MSVNGLQVSTEQETAVKQLLRQAAKRRRRAYSVIVRHGTETDANREFASHGDADNALVWFFFALPAFMILHAVCVKLGAI
jgi:hypothetical protein